MPTANLNPKNNLLPMLIIGAGLGWFLLRRQAVAGQSSALVASQAAATLQQQAADAARNAAMLNLAGNFGNWLGNLRPSLVTPDARAIVREGDPYYGTPTYGDPATAAAWSIGPGLGQDTLSNMSGGSDYAVNERNW